MKTRDMILEFGINLAGWTDLWLIGAPVSLSDWLFSSLPADQVLYYTYMLIGIQQQYLKAGIRVKFRVRSERSVSISKA